MSNSTLFFQPSCPSGGSFYVCDTPKSSFVGCCATDVDPCTSPNGCSKGNLRSSSFDKTYYGQFHDQSCNDGSFFTCTGTKPGPFMGCCKSNPCASGGCAAVDLEAMRLSSDPKAAADFLGTAIPSSSSSSNTASTTAPGTSRSSSTSTALPAEIPHQTGLPAAAIGGIVIGVVLLLALAIVLLFLWRRTVNLRRAVLASNGPPGFNNFDGMSCTTYPAMAHSNNPTKGMFSTRRLEVLTLTDLQHSHTLPTHHLPTPPLHPLQIFRQKIVKAILLLHPVGHRTTQTHALRLMEEGAHNSVRTTECYIRSHCYQSKNSRH